MFRTVFYFLFFIFTFNIYAQDLNNIDPESPMEMDINFHGKGTLVSALWKTSTRYTQKQQAFKGDL